MSLDAVLARIDAELPQALDRLMDLLRIPSISTDPAYKADCARAADVLAADLASLGFEARAAQAHQRVQAAAARTKARGHAVGVVGGDPAADAGRIQVF